MKVQVNPEVSFGKLKQPHGSTYSHHMTNLDSRNAVVFLIGSRRGRSREHTIFFAKVCLFFAAQLCWIYDL